jgi:hypothetical protein
MDVDSPQAMPYPCFSVLTDEDAAAIVDGIFGRFLLYFCKYQWIH